MPRVRRGGFLLGGLGLACVKKDLTLPLPQYDEASLQVSGAEIEAASKASKGGRAIKVGFRV